MTLTDGDPSETDSPTEVTIPAGQDSVTVLVDPVDDPEVDGDQTAPITATAPGYPETVQEVLVEDDDVNGSNTAPIANDDSRTINYDDYAADINGIVSVRNVLSNDEDPDDGDSIKVIAAGDDATPDSRGWFDWIDASEGGQIRINVNGQSLFRNGDVFADVPLGESVTTSVEYTIADEAGETATATVSVTINGTADSGTPTLTIEPGPDATLDSQGRPELAENGDPVEFVITRSGPTEQPLLVTLTSDDPTEATTPTFVIIPAGETSVTVTVSPEDDLLVDGTQFPTLTANADGFDPAEIEVSVADDDDTGAPTLTIEPGPDTPLDSEGRPALIENGDHVDVVITRTGPTDDPLLVLVSSNDTSEASVPQYAVILPGETSVTVSVCPEDDLLVDGTQFPILTATASGFDPATLEVSVEDDDDGSGANTVIALDDNYELALADLDPGTKEDLGNVLVNDSDPQDDFFVFQELGDDNTADANGWFGWVDGSEGGEFRVSQTGEAQFRYADDEFVDLTGVIETEVTYTVLDARGATDTATISVEIEGDPVCGCSNDLGYDWDIV